MNSFAMAKGTRIVSNSEQFDGAEIFPVDLTQNGLGENCFGRSVNASEALEAQDA
jgi:hypothetical protein